MTRAGILLVTLLVLDACAPLVGTECASGEHRNCLAASGRVGTQACLRGVWDDCVEPLPMSDSGSGTLDAGTLPGSDAGTSSGTDSGSASVDSGFYLWPDAGRAELDAGMPGSDAGSASADSGLSGTDPEALQRQYCEDRRPLSDMGVLVVRYDNACLDLLFGACAGGWSLVAWDSSVPSCPSPSDHGSGILLLERMHRLGGYYQLSLHCNDGRTPDWSDALRNDPVNTGCITSVRFEDGIERADDEARFCSGLVDGSQLLATVPTFPGAIANCP